jgi:uncharacterized membrane protein HdeD (DUF308 family)
MQAATAINLKSQMTQVAWMVSAINGAFLTLFGAVMVCNTFGYDAQLAPLMAHIGTMFAVAGVALAAFSLTRARSTR